MANIGTTIGSIVGVFIALLIGLSLFNEVADSVANLFDYETEGYDEGVDYGVVFLDGFECTHQPNIPVVVRVDRINSEGGLLIVGDVTRTGVNCGGRTGDFDATLTAEGTTLIIGEGAILTVTLTNGVPGTTVIKEAGGMRVIGVQASDFIALDVLLNLLPTIVLVGLLAAGGVIGGFIGRDAGGRFA